MKAAIVIPDGLSALLFCKGIIRTLKKNVKGIDISIISADGIYKKDIEALGVKSISIEMHRFLSPPSDIVYFIRLYRLFKREGFNTVINFSTKPNIYGAFAAKLAHTEKIILHVVGMGTVFLPSRNARGRIIQYALEQLYRIACKFSYRVWFTNKDDSIYFIQHRIAIQNKVILTKNYLDTDYYSPELVKREDLAKLRHEFALSDRDKVVVMVARMIWAKGIKEFAEAAELLKDRHPHLKFFLIAPLENGNPDSVPQSYIREKEARSNLKWLGFREDVKNIYALSILAVLPSYYREGGFPRALLEPMSMGRPIITTDSVHCKDAVEEGRNGCLVPARDSKALANAIENLVKDDAIRREFGNYARLKAKREFDENAIIQKVMEQII